MSEKGKWYESTLVTIVVTIAFFPLGLALLWFNSKFTKKTKAIATICVLFAVVSITSSNQFKSGQQSVTNQTRITTESKPVKAKTVQAKPAKKLWYEGGTLHQANALQWQVATHRDKLATAADFLTSLWTKHSFKPQIQTRISSVDDLKPLAVEMVKFLDSATEPEADPQKNKQLYVNQKVSSMASMGLILMGWMK